jgi:hypothetical protein
LLSTNLHPLQISFSYYHLIKLTICSHFCTDELIDEAKVTSVFSSTINVSPFSNCKSCSQKSVKLHSSGGNNLNNPYANIN